MLLSSLLLILFINFIIIFYFIQRNYTHINNKLKELTLCINLCVFVLSLVLWYLYDSTTIFFQFLYFKQIYSFTFHLGVDGFSLFFIILTTFIFPICLLTEWENYFSVNKRLMNFLATEIFLIMAFSAVDLFLFFISFEAATIPIFLLIGGWGSYPKRIKAAFYFFFFTFISSLAFLYGLIFLYVEYGTSNYYVLSTLQIPFSHQLILWFCFALPFSFKAPLFPFHIWLPEAHVEAPTSGSILLAAVILKLGVYGYLRFVISICFDANLFFKPIMCTLLIVGLVYTTITTFRQVDLKRIIAYSSVTHMIYIMLGIVSCTVYGVVGSLYLSLAHGISATALFFIVGLLYERGHTRLLEYYGGLCTVMPIYTSLLFVFCFANFGLPFTMNFIGEYLILVGLTKFNFFIAFLSLSGIFGSIIYSMWFFNRLAFTNFKLNYLLVLKDLTRRELYIILPLLGFIILGGICPNIILFDLFAMVNKQLILFY